MFYSITESPLGPILVVADQDGLKAVSFLNGTKPHQIDAEWQEQETAVITQTKDQLQAYFNGELDHFDIPLNAEGTSFQKQVWNELIKIPYGETIDYGTLACRIGNTKASRAVGAANGKNPIAIIVPCHRVIGRSGKLTGYAGGLDIKDHLLRLEQDHHHGPLFGA